MAEKTLLPMGWAYQQHASPRSGGPRLKCGTAHSLSQEDAGRIEEGCSCVELRPYGGRPVGVAICIKAHKILRFYGLWIANRWPLVSV